MQSNQGINNVITKVNIIATICVIFSHADIRVLFENVPNAYMAVYTAVDVAVTSFFFISAFLFYTNVTDIKKQYGTKIKSRVKSLLIPYFLFGIVWMIIYSLCSLLPVIGSFINDSAFRSDWKTNVLSILMGSYNPPMWFLRALFLLQLISPLFYLIIKKTKYWCSLILIIAVYLLNITFNFGYISPLSWLPIFIIGIWYAVYFEEINNRLHVFFERTYLQIIAFMVFLCLVAIATWQSIMGNESGWFYYSYRLVGSIIMLVLAVSRLGEKKCNHPIKNYTFIIYLLHYPIAQIIKRILFKILGNVPMAEWIIYILTILLTLATTWLIGIIISRVFPRTWSFINGGRQPIKYRVKGDDNGR